MDDNEKVQPAPPPPVQPRAITPVIAISPPVSPPMSPAMSPEPIDDMPVRTNPNAPRISVRPVSQFLPSWSLEKQAAAAAAGGAVGVAVTGDAADRPNTSQSDHPANPFGQQAERVPSPIHEDASPRATYTPYTPSEVSVSDSASISEIPHADEAVAATAVAASAIAAGAAGAVAGASTLARKQSMRNRNANNVDLTVNTLDTVPPSPAGTEFSVSTPATGSAPQPSQSAAAIAAAGGPANSTVHRVQLDFKPTLDDEVGLKAGDLIRLLHEYDDGWVST